jgi:hypothetical protein
VEINKGDSPTLRRSESFTNVVHSLGFSVIVAIPFADPRHPLVDIITANPWPDSKVHLSDHEEWRARSPLLGQANTPDGSTIVWVNTAHHMIALEHQIVVHRIRHSLGASSISTGTLILYLSRVDEGADGHSFTDPAGERYNLGR